ncbi:hypothetical protein NCCP2495_15970 [Dietzia sp. NCCP-2495]|uniref:PPE domain-containing protein n=1 Tax=Dietzia sp. NCCP-2495 TaxID=2934675 RepID=UPI002231C083|nr:PPE domain-containing protein [Dietzia sp. NCCP-2495]GLB63718.1 hypothetical protein NCCP2495_15970 [Dietzia sp. NCCP-2495]
MTERDGTVGFTGVEWDQRTPDDLARALTAGPGPGQAGELAAAWTAAAEELEAVSSEYRRLAVELAADWVSEATPHLDARSREVADDVFGLAAHARELADRAGGHAHDHTVARATMPRVEEIEVTGRALDALDSLGPGLAGVLTGATDALETRSADLRRAAATVMAYYEARTAPLEVPRERPPATRHLLPGLLARTAGDTVPSAAADRVAGSTGSAGSLPSTSSSPAAVAAPLAPFTAAGAIPTGSPGSTQPTEAQVRPATAAPTAPGTGPTTPVAPAAGGTSAERAGAGLPMIPPVARAAGAAGNGDDAHQADGALRTAPGPAEIEELYGLSVAVAPPVFGGTPPEPAAVSTGSGVV